MIPVTCAATKTISVTLLIYGCITLLVALGSGLPGDAYYFIQTANMSIWIPSAVLLMAILIGEWITNGLFFSHV
jgi:hypothetical protein